MASRIPEPIASFRTTLTNKITSTATTIYIDSVTDDDGTSMNGKIIQCLIDKGLSTEEYVQGTVDSATMSLTGCLRGLSVVDGATEVSGNKSEHRKKATIEITDHPSLAMVVRRMNGTDAFDADNRPYADVDQDATSDAQFVTAGQLSRTALGTTTASKVFLPGTAGETIAIDQLVYLKASDQRWWLCDADTAATVENVQLGISRGAGTAGNAITGGVHRSGEHIAASAVFTLGKVFASNTAGGFSSSAGTKEVSLGVAYATTKIDFQPRFEQQITEDEQDALAGSDGTPSSTNKFVTQTDAIRAPIYAATAVGTDAYAITPSPAITAYADGQEFKIKLDVSNTGPCTLAVNGLTARSIVKGVSTALVTGDLLANQIITVKYNSTGTVFQLVDTPANLVSGATLTDQHFHSRKFISASRAQDGANGAVTYAHGLGVTPKWVRASMYGTTAGGVTESQGSYDGSAHVCISRNNGVGIQDTTNLIQFYDSAGIQAGAVTALDATNITITWTKTSSPGAGTMVILLEAGV